MTKPFSVAAQTVLDAAIAVNDLVCTDSIAAALRAAADQAAPVPTRGSKDMLLSFLTIRHRLLAIADKLEALDV